MIRDSYGLIVSKDRLTGELDGGDSARATWCFWLAQYLLGKVKSVFEKPSGAVNSFYQDMNILETYPGFIIRNPKPNTFWTDVAYTSRDQTLGAIICAGIFDHNFLSRLWRAHKKRYFFCSNNKDTLIAYFSLWIRAYNFKFLWPILWFTDLFFVLSAMERAGILPRWVHEKKRLIWIRDPDDVGDDWNLILCLAQPNLETPIRNFARWFYINYRQENFGEREFGEKCKPIAAILWYERAYGNGTGNPVLASMWKKILYEW